MIDAKLLVRGVALHVVLPWFVAAALILFWISLYARLGFEGLCVIWVLAWLLFIALCMARRDVTRFGREARRANGFWSGTAFFLFMVLVMAFAYFWSLPHYPGEALLL